MTANVIFLSVPGLRSQDVDRMPHLSQLVAEGDRATLVPSFPCVTWPVQANMLTGKLANEHGVIANGFFWRETGQVEMWTAWNEAIEQPQIWDTLHDQTDKMTSLVWFPMLSKGCGADYVCMPAPVHNPDGSESLWCYTKPKELYGELLERLGHFPLQHFWGPIANIKSTQWIAQSSLYAAEEYKPRFSYLYLPHLDYAAQKLGPNSPAALRAVTELDNVIGELAAGIGAIDGFEKTTWMVASEYVIVPVDHVVYPNRLLRESGLLSVTQNKGGEYLDVVSSRAWAMVDHQFAHVFVKDADAQVSDQVRQIFERQEGIAEVLVGEERSKYHMNHSRSGEVILVSDPNSWQAYYWWEDDAKAPSFARTVDIHQKPGYDPVELHFDGATKSTPLDGSLVKGSHGAPATDVAQQGVILCSEPDCIQRDSVKDTDVAGLIMNSVVQPNRS